MRVLQTIASLGTGGAERLLVELCLRFRGLGVQPDVYVSKSVGGPLERRIEEAGIRLFRSRGNSYYSPLQIRELRQIITAGSYDVVHAHLTPAQLWTSLAARGLGRRPALITTEHSTSNRRRLRLFRPFDRVMYSRFCRIACISSGVYDALLEWFGQSLPPMEVIPNGIDLGSYMAPRRASKKAVYGTSAPVILCTASLTPGKDQATLIRAVSIVADVHVFLAGDGPMREKLRQLSWASGTHDRVHFLGVRRDVQDLIGAADLYVQPSSVEGFGLAVVEAMAGGLPVIASAVPGLREVVGDAGLFFSTGDHLGLAHRVEELLREPVLRSDLAERGRKRAESFDVNRTASAYALLYKAVTGGTRHLAVGKSGWG
jgi:glycosyltransferase involved in cell wall biosynthesis